MVRRVDSEGNELEKVECPRCGGTAWPGTEERVEKKGPGHTHSHISLCSLCHGSKEVWIRKEELST